MKKLICMLCVMLALTCVLVACVGNDASNEDADTTATSQENTQKETQDTTEETTEVTTEVITEVTTEVTTEKTTEKTTEVTTEETNSNVTESTTENTTESATENETETESVTEDSSTADECVNVEDIVFSSVYSDGVAVVNLRSEENVAYVIDKSGKIVFNFIIKEETPYLSNTIKSMIFQKGLLIYNGICYDKTGRAILPESVGVTAFVEIVDGEYIIVEKVVADYATSKKELGVLNMNFEWIVQLTEGSYDLYYSNSSEANEFFWEEVVRSKDDVKKIFRFDRYSLYSGIYMSDGTVLTTESANVADFLEVYESKYIVAMTTEGTVGVMNLSGVWLLEPSEKLSYVYHNASIEIKNDVLSAKNDDMIVYYDFTTKASSIYNKDQICADYCNGAAVTEIHGKYDDNGYKVEETVFGTVESDRIDEFEISVSDNDKYILVRAHQSMMLKGESYGENVEYEDYMDVFAVMSRDSKWIVKGVLGEVEIKGDYLCVSGDFENGYYDLRTGEFTEQKPVDFPEDDEDGDDDTDVDVDVNTGFDVTQITNYYMATGFVNGKAAVALKNYDVGYMYITIVNAEGEFLFEPVRLKFDSDKAHNMQVYFDGEYVVVSDNRGCGTGYITSSLTLYTYNISGELVAERKMSDELQCYNCSFKYSDGVVVFSITHGQYSDYYRQSEVRYYTYDLQPLF